MLGHVMRHAGRRLRAHAPPRVALSSISLLPGAGVFCVCFKIQTARCDAPAAAIYSPESSHAIEDGRRQAIQRLWRRVVLFLQCLRRLLKHSWTLAPPALATPAALASFTVGISTEW